MYVIILKQNIYVVLFHFGYVNVMIEEKKTNFFCVFMCVRDRLFFLSFSFFCL